VDHEQRRREIVEAAWRLVARGGFAAATMREIAAEAGFANGALKYYFDSKDDLLIAAFQHTFYRVNERAPLV
jgi:AcrR family transcriptional regulator